jgi:ribosomal protein L20
MARVKRGVTGHAKHKKVLKAAKGYYGRRKNTIRVAKQAVEMRTSTPIATASAASARSEHSGSSASMPRCARSG